MPVAPHKQGLSVVELMVAMAIGFFLIFVIVSAFSTFSRRQSIDATTHTIAGALEDARAQTLASKNALQYGVHFDTNQIVVFSGATYVSNAATNRTIPLGSAVQVQTVTLQGGGNDVVFKRLTGETDQWGTVTLFTPSASTTSVISITETGIPKIN